MMNLLQNYDKTHEPFDEPEGHSGRADIILLYKGKPEIEAASGIDVIVELKCLSVASDFNGRKNPPKDEIMTKLKKRAKFALDQIDDRKYSSILEKQNNVRQFTCNIVKIGLAAFNNYTYGIVKKVIDFDGKIELQNLVQVLNGRKSFTDSSQSGIREI
jgi:hypothetical protein